jgi:hypothetical protein
MATIAADVSGIANALRRLVDDFMGLVLYAERHGC